MKRVHYLISAAALAIALTGCGTTGTDLPGGGYPDLGDQQGQEAHNNDLEQNSAIPPQQVGTGFEFDLASFMYAYPALNDKSVEKEFLVTTQNQQNYFNAGKSYTKRIQEGLTDDLGDKIVNIFSDNTLTERAVINETRITVTYYQNDVESGTEQYRRNARLHEDMYRTQDGACVYKDIFDNGLDLGEIVPRQANPNEGIAHFAKALHVYCGTRTGDTTDRYYADGWGVIAEITHAHDGTTTYSALNQSTYTIN